MSDISEIEFDTKPNRGIRYLGTARDAFTELGIPDFQRHVLVAVVQQPEGHHPQRRPHGPGRVVLPGSDQSTDGTPARPAPD